EHEFINRGPSYKALSGAVAPIKPSFLERCALEVKLVRSTYWPDFGAAKPKSSTSVSRATCLCFDPRNRFTTAVCAIADHTGLQALTVLAGAACPLFFQSLSICHSSPGDKKG